MVEVIKSKVITKEQFPFIVRFNSKEQYLTKKALEELRDKINLVIN